MPWGLSRIDGRTVEARPHETHFTSDAPLTTDDFWKDERNEGRSALSLQLSAVSLQNPQSEIRN
jgi:hypothetical protein